MKKQNDSFKGQIGQNISQSRIEIEENILRTLYEWWIQDRRLYKDAVCEKLGFSRRKLSYYIHSMIQHGYLEVAPESEEMILTDFGKEQGHECRDRHQNITHFIQLTCGVDEQVAAESACRMEHVVSEEVIDGIFRFLKNGEVYDRELRNVNFNVLYKPGCYKFCMTIYESDKRYPRILAKEFAQFQEHFLLEVGEEESTIYLLPQSEEFDWTLWYKRDNDWKRCRRTDKGLEIPASVFVVIKSQLLPIMEGNALLGLTRDNCPPEAAECRELNIHIW